MLHSAMSWSFILSAFVASTSATFTAGVNNNVAVYWGQGPFQARLVETCRNPNVDIVIIGFINVFPNQGQGGYPGSNFGNACGAATFKNKKGVQTQLLSSCPDIGPDITECQNTYGKKILLSLGGGYPTNYFIGSDQAAVNFANFLWGAFGPVTSKWTADKGPRPFGGAVVDGFDFDIESELKKAPTFQGKVINNYRKRGYVKMIQTLKKQLFPKDTSKNYYISGSPQCLVPDVHFAQAVQKAWFDFLFIQFYNTPSCSARAGVNHIEGASSIDISYSKWSDVPFFNKNAKIYIGVPGSTAASSSFDYYLPPLEVDLLIRQYYSDPKFGGIMLWEATYAANNVVCGKNYPTWIKQLLNAAQDGTKINTVTDDCPSVKVKCGSCPDNPVSTDGRCGPNSGSTCAGSSFGPCCGADGFCSSSYTVCSSAAGCDAQYADCSAASEVQPPKKVKRQGEIAADANAAVSANISATLSSPIQEAASTTGSSSSTSELTSITISTSGLATSQTSSLGTEVSLDTSFSLPTSEVASSTTLDEPIFSAIDVSPSSLESPSSNTAADDLPLSTSAPVVSSAGDGSGSTSIVAASVTSLESSPVSVQAIASTTEAGMSVSSPESLPSPLGTTSGETPDSTSDSNSDAVFAQAIDSPSTLISTITTTLFSAVTSTVTVSGTLSTITTTIPITSTITVAPTSETITNTVIVPDTITFMDASEGASAEMTSTIYSTIYFTTIIPLALAGGQQPAGDDETLYNPHAADAEADWTRTTHITRTETILQTETVTPMTTTEKSTTTVVSVVTVAPVAQFGTKGIEGAMRNRVVTSALIGGPNGTVYAINAGGKNGTLPVMGQGQGQEQSSQGEQGVQMPTANSGERLNARERVWGGRVVGATGVCLMVLFS